MLKRLVNDYSGSSFRACTFGGHPHMDQNPDVLLAAIDTAVELGADRNKVCVMAPASGPADYHFKKVSAASTTTSLESRVWADGVYTTEIGAAVIMPSADCQFIVMKNLVTNCLVVGHGGKPAMRTWELVNLSEMHAGPGPTEIRRLSIIDQCLDYAVRRAFPNNVHVHLANTIGARHYAHDDARTAQDRDYFWRYYGPEVFYDQDQAAGRLDLKAMSRRRLLDRNVPTGNISDDGQCTVCHPDLVSYRAKRQTSERNIGIAINLPVKESTY